MSFSFSQGSGLLFHEVSLLSDLTYQASVSKSLNAFRFQFHLTFFFFLSINSLLQFLFLCILSSFVSLSYSLSFENITDKVMESTSSIDFFKRCTLKIRRANFFMLKCIIIKKNIFCLNV